ncbi:unnamed protein product, partial [Didymodactylos carnosus]
FIWLGQRIKSLRQLNESDIEMTKTIITLNQDQNVFLIWFDNNIDIKIQNELKHLHVHFLICSTFDELMNTIDKIENNNKIILIVSGQYSRYTLHSLHSNDKIDSFYIFCMYRDLYEDLIYSKLIGIYTEYALLHEAVEKRLHSLVNHFSIFKIYEQTNKSLRDLEQESVNYLQYHLLRDTLLNMVTETEESKQEMLDYCRVYFHGQSKRLEQINEFEKTYQSSDAILWYTKTNTFVYQFINHALRTENFEALYSLRYFIIDLCKNLKFLFNENFEENQVLDEITFYRGLTLPDRDIEQLKQSIGKYVSTNGFLSTSFYRHIAEKFSSNALFVIRIDTKLKNTIYADISNLSMMYDEQEALFDLGAVFQVTNVLPENDKWIVSLTAVDDVEYLSHNQFFKRLRTILKRICGMGSEMTSLQFGHFLVNIGRTDKAVEHFETLMHRPIVETKYKIICIYSLSYVYNETGKLDLALEYAFQANDIIKVITDSNTTLTFIIELIGDIYMNKKQFDLALEYYVKAIKYVDANELFLIAQYHFDIGRIYFLQNNLEFSLKHCLQSLEILDEMFPLISIDHLHQFLSKIYFQISNYPMAIKHAEKALAIDKEMYSVQDKRNTDTYILLGDIYFSTKQYDLSIEYLTKGVEFLIYKKSKYYNQISTSYITIASCYFRKKIYDKACRYFIKALITKELHLDDVDNMEEMNFIIGQLNFCIAECYSEMN